jgi:DMSO/TMAO reductase YedYZ heme-binding membrane subunit
VVVGLLAAVALVVALPALGASRTSRSLLAPVLAFLSFYSGVFALVALSLTVMVGLLATDHAILSMRYRLAAQAVHRSTTLVALVFLATHIAAKVLTGRVRPADAVLPFLAPGRAFYVGLGTLASDLLVVIASTGFFRRRFAGGRAPGAWRVLHTAAYLAWALSIVHGLVAGRQPAWWVVWSYALCLVAVALALLARVFLAVGPNRSAAGRRGQPHPVPAARRRPGRRQVSAASKRAVTSDGRR